MAMVWTYYFMSCLLFTSSQYIPLNKKYDCKSNDKYEKMMVEIQTLRDQQTKLQRELDELRQDNKEIRDLLISRNQSPLDCFDIYTSGQRDTGVYQIYPFGEINNAVNVMCDMDLQGGGWTVIQNRHRENPRVNFNTTWDKYKSGFGDVRGNYWLGNDVIHKLTTKSPNDLYIKMKSTSNQSYKVKYTSFSISDEADGYRLSLGNKSGRIDDAFKSYSILNEPFSTFDMDNNHKCGVLCGSGPAHFE
ncbi:microfibril-associated glycoprotein 4-like [Saccostrea echinata]|uniref:microfibril-associated glycoprotein 4-like n=1 Tax=Saccostrea echinata TaxID=191078 RepID=UPI002A7EAB73|nr:microfibril-associated glycoprotein 4-like [Saccostrea echinata]